jgi:hypothetical protein
VGDFRKTDYNPSLTADHRHYSATGPISAAVAAGVGALMEKPLDLPLLLQAIKDLLSEPIEQRFSRFTGKRPFTRYLQTQVRRGLFPMKLSLRSRLAAMGAGDFSVGGNNRGLCRHHLATGSKFTPTF